MDLNSVTGSFSRYLLKSSSVLQTKMGHLLALYTGVFFVSDTTRDIYWHYMRFKSIADVLCSRTIFFEDNVKPDATLSLRQVQCCTA